MSDHQTRSDLPQWKALEDAAQKSTDVQICNLFQTDPTRFEHFHLCHENIMLDYSKQPLTQQTLDKLIALATACDLEKWRDKMFAGDLINTTENRAVLHTALRTQESTPILVKGTNIIPQIKDMQERIKTLCTQIRQEKKFTHIVNIGIGGSDLGSSMVYEALKPFSDRAFHLHFVSNIDGTHLTEILRLIDPKTTLFIIASKSFTTQETLTNAQSAKIWLQSQLETQDVSQHFIAISHNIKAAQDFGITAENIFPLWNWVGGRYSLWSSIALSFCIALGFERYQDMLDGAYSMDQHFRQAPLDQNMPVLLAMIGVWHRNFLKYPALSITPYDQYLKYFPAYLQQLDMESNGKSIDRQHQAIPYETGSIIIGETGTNAQHAYFQLLHQGTQIIPSDFIIVAKTQNPLADHHTKLLANAIAQTKALMEGAENTDPHKSFAGNRPSNTLILDALTPYTLGMLLALYEHKIFVQGIIWNINSFDQCGVELGKTLAKKIIGHFDHDHTGKDTILDPSTTGILKYIKNL